MTQGPDFITRAIEQLPSQFATTQEGRTRELIRQREEEQAVVTGNRQRIKDAIQIFREGRAARLSDAATFASEFIETPEEATQLGLLRNLQRKPTDEEIGAFIDDVVFRVEDLFRDSQGNLTGDVLPNNQTIREYVEENLFNTGERGLEFSDPAQLSPAIAAVNEIILSDERMASFLPTRLTTREKYISAIQTLDDFDLLPDALAARLRRINPAELNLTAEDMDATADFAVRLMEAVPDITEGLIQRELASPDNPLSGSFELELSNFIASTPVEQILSGQTPIPQFPPTAEDRIRAQRAEEEFATQDFNAADRIRQRLRQLGIPTEGPDAPEGIEDFISRESEATELFLSQFSDRGLLTFERNRLMEQFFNENLPEDPSILLSQIQEGQARELSIGDAQKQIRDAFLTLGIDSPDDDIVNEAARTLHSNANFPIGVQLSPEQVASGFFDEIGIRERLAAIEEATSAIEAQGAQALTASGLQQRGFEIPGLAPRVSGGTRASQAAEANIFGTIFGAIQPRIDREIALARAEQRVPDIQSVIDDVLAQPTEAGIPAFFAQPQNIAGVTGQQPFGPPRDLVTGFTAGPAVAQGRVSSAPPSVPQAGRAIASQRRPVVTGEEFPDELGIDRLLENLSGGDEGLREFASRRVPQLLSAFQAEQESALNRERAFQSGRIGRRPISRNPQVVGPTFAAVAQERFPEIEEEFRRVQPQLRRRRRGGRRRDVGAFGAA